MSSSEDGFAQLGFEKRAALDAQAVQAAFDERMRCLHPDQSVGQESEAVALNHAYQRLRESESRLKHLLELEVPELAGQWSTGRLTDSLMEWFTKTGALLGEIDQWSSQRESASSGLAKALLTARQMEMQERVEALLEGIEAERGRLDAQLPEVDLMRAASDLGWVDLAKELRIQFSYLNRWKEQLREALMKLI